MTRRPEKTAAATRKARQGGGGFLGMEEMAKLAGAAKCEPCGGTGAVLVKSLNDGKRYCLTCWGTGVKP